MEFSVPEVGGYDVSSVALVESASGLPFGDGFWESTPHWAPHAARCSAGSRLFVWAGDVILELPSIARALVEHFDGVATLDELVEDLAFAADQTLGWARRVAIDAVTLLEANGAILGVHPPVESQATGSPAGPTAPTIDTPAETLIETTAIDPETGETIRVTTEVAETGNVVTTEYFPDGRRRISTTMTIDSASDDPEVQRVFTGDRSPAELIPAGSCVGSKLRNSDDVPLLSFRGSDGRIRSVRCHSDEVADALRSRGAERLVEWGERGPVLAFVVTPLEGVGPVRVYDAFGRRRGRPRGTDEVVDLIDGLFVAHRIAVEAPSVTSPIPLRLTVLRRGGETVLVPESALDHAATRGAWRSDGWAITWSRGVLDVDGRVAVPTEFPPRSSQGRETVDIAGQLDPERAMSLVSMPAADDQSVRQALLERTCAFVSMAATARPSTHPTTAPTRHASVCIEHLPGNQG